MTAKTFVDEQQLLEDSFRLARQIYASDFRPDFIVGVWRGGSTVGIYVQECLQYLGVASDHIPVRTSYSGRDDYLRRLSRREQVQAHGLQYLYDNLSAGDRLLIVDDVYSTGRHVTAIIEQLKHHCRRNMAAETRVAAVYFRPPADNETRPPDYYLHRVDDWLVLPYELTDLGRDEMLVHKPWIVPLLDELKTDWH